jgi:hypothetical protein
MKDAEGNIMKNCNDKPILRNRFVPAFDEEDEVRADYYTKAAEAVKAAKAVKAGNKCDLDALDALSTWLAINDNAEFSTLPPAMGPPSKVDAAGDDEYSPKDLALTSSEDSSPSDEHKQE